MKYCPETLVASVTAAAIAIADSASPDELQILSAVFSQLGDTLATICAARESCSPPDMGGCGGKKGKAEEYD